MGLRGPAAKGNANLPKFEPGIPPKPANLTAVASEHWDEITPLLDKAEVITHGDGPALSIMCETYASFVHYRKVVNAAPLVKGAKGTAIVNPVNRLMRESLRQYNDSLAAFGMTPRARLRVSVTGRHFRMNEGRELISEVEKAMDVAENLATSNVSALLTAAAREQVKNGDYST